MQPNTKITSLPPINTTSSKKIKAKLETERPGDYINQSMKYIEDGSYQNGKLKIDGSIGDYKMSIFRLKDRNRRRKQIPTAFTKTFVTQIEDMTPDLKEEFRKLAEAPKQKYLKKQKQEQIQNVKYQPLKWESEIEEHLMCQYIPSYQKEKWFIQTVDNSNSYKPPKIELEEEKVVKKVSKRKNNRKHIFRFLDNDSMIF